MNKKSVVLIIIMGLLYMNIENIFRAILNFPTNGFALKGWSSLWMIFIGGISGFLIDIMNEQKTCIVIFKIKKKIGKRIKSIKLQCLLGSIITTLIELIAGLILNVSFGFALWDYSKLPLNIMGQICLIFSISWYLLMPIGIYTGDLLRYYIYDEEKPERLIDIYKKALIPFYDT